MDIPGIIHQTWKTASVPEEFTCYTGTWKTFHPAWDYRLWTDDDNRRFLQAHYPSFMDVYDAYSSNIKRADAVRYFLLHHYGGLYADLDFECLKSLEPLFAAGRTCLLGYEPALHSKKLYNRRRLVCNAIMASAPGHRFWKHVFSVLRRNADERDVMDATGPRMLEQALESYPFDDVTLVSDQVFYPLVDVRNVNLQLTPRQSAYYRNMHEKKAYPESSYAVHHWAGTWYRGGIREKGARLLASLKNRIVRFFI